MYTDGDTEGVREPGGKKRGERCVGRVTVMAS